MSTSQKGKAYKGMAMEGFIARWYARNTGKKLEPFRKEAREIAKQVPGGGDVLEMALALASWRLNLPGSVRTTSSAGHQQVVRPHGHGECEECRGRGHVSRGQYFLDAVESNSFDFNLLPGRLQEFQRAGSGDQRNVSGAEAGRQGDDSTIYGRTHRRRQSRRLSRNWRWAGSTH